MRLLADASVDFRLVRRLRALGVDVQALIETAATTLDPDVLAEAHASDMIPLTEDKGFGDLVFGKALPTYGVILIRTRIASDADIDVVAVRVIEASRRARGAFVTLTRRQLRVRALS
ncbi:MAG: DUF5615 family PIN-like protein [Vitreimonas sp.]